MKLGRGIRISMRSIAGHKLRSTLTTLGVIIGVGTVITFMVLGGAIAADFTSEFENLYGDDAVLMVQTETPLQGGVGIAFTQAPIYTQHDIDTIAAIDRVTFVAPIGPIDAVQVTHGNQRLTGAIDVRGTTADAFGFDEFEDGVAFEDGSAGAVINTRVSDAFGGVSVGDEISFTKATGERTTVTVTGIIIEDLFGQPATMYVPADPHYTTVVDTPRDTVERGYPFLWIGIDSFDSVSTVQDEVREFFNSGADATLLKGADDVIQVQTIDDLVTQITELIDQLTVFVVGIAAIALVVGAIGIANIMIVSVVERTREIGLMKAVGAHKRDVLQLFLVESAILGVVGAGVGVLLGFAVGGLGVWLAGWPMVYPLGWVAGTVIVGVLVGIVAGIYPAWRAASVDPIVALTRE